MQRLPIGAYNKYPAGKRRQNPHTACERGPICACICYKVTSQQFAFNVDRLCTKRYMIRSPPVQLTFCLCVVSTRSLSLIHSHKKPKSRIPQHFYYLLIIRDPDFESRTAPTQYKKICSQSERIL